MASEQFEALRVPFPPETVGKLPKAGIQLDYVGHAAVTDRLLTVDPHWWWEPFATDDAGLPAVTYGPKDASLWIWLHVAGVSRIGVGTAPVAAGDLFKQLIGDAIRNAAMRFGVALDLWSRDELESQVTPERVLPPQVPRILEAVGSWPKDDPRRGVLHDSREKRGWPARPADYDDATAAEVWTLVQQLDSDAEPFDVTPSSASAGETMQVDEQTEAGGDSSSVAPPVTVVFTQALTASVSKDAINHAAARLKLDVPTSGSKALQLQAFSVACPELTADEVIDLIRQTAPKETP
jgi:hypothetical protein